MVNAYEETLRIKTHIFLKCVIHLIRLSAIIMTCVTFFNIIFSFGKRTFIQVPTMSKYPRYDMLHS